MGYSQTAVFHEFYAPTKQILVYSQNITPLSYRLSLPIKRNPVVAPSIIRLLFHSRPHDITRLIIPIIVNAFKPIALLWSPSHVFKKGRKTIPSFVHLNPPSSVMVVSWRIRVVTSLPHTFPYSIFCRLFAVDSHAWLCPGNTHILSSLTAATFYKSSSNVAYFYRFFITARTEPNTPAFPSAFNESQLIVSVSRLKFYQFFHFFNYSTTPGGLE